MSKLIERLRSKWRFLNSRASSELEREGEESPPERLPEFDPIGEVLDFIALDEEMDTVPEPQMGDVHEWERIASSGSVTEEGLFWRYFVTACEVLDRKLDRAVLKREIPADEVIRLRSFLQTVPKMPEATRHRYRAAMKRMEIKTKLRGRREMEDAGPIARRFLKDEEGVRDGGK